MESLGKQLETLQLSMHEREAASSSKINSLGKEVRLGQKEKKMLEQRVRELQDQLQQRHQDTLNQSKMVGDKDQVIKKLKGDLERVKRERDDAQQRKQQMELRVP